MSTTTLYTGSSGLANKVHPEMIPYDPETGIAGLQRADNILIGKAGQAYCRKGSRQVYSTESCHSPIPVAGGKFLCVLEKKTSAAIALGSPDSTGEILVTELGPLNYRGSKASWFEMDGEYWFSTESERRIATADFGMVNWPVSTGMMADSNEFEYAPLPFGRHSEQHGKFTLSASGQFIYSSEPGQPTLYRPAENYRAVEGPVKLLASVHDGVYVSDDKAVWFLQGMAPREWTTRRVLNYPAIEYCKVHGLVSAADMGFDSGSLGVVFMTVKGPVFGFPDGTVINLTEKQFAMPSGCNFTHGSMMIANDSTLIISVE